MAEDVFTRLKAGLADSYTIERELGAGGMATVYLAEDLKHHRKVAVKVLRPELAETIGSERFLREIEIAARLTHPHILPLHDSGDADGFLFYVMPYIEGESLRTKLTKEVELPISEAVRILRDVLDALADAHEHGVVHRDIKPENILLSKHHALVTDFGVAKAVSEATGREQLTTAGVALGTPTYMSPEQAAAEPNVDHRADIYAVGAVAYELLAGRPPFLGTTSQMILSAHMTDAPEPVSKYRGAVPPSLEQLVMKCLEKKAADRWQSAAELLPQLEALATPSGGVTPTTTRPVSAVEKKPQMLVWSVVAVAAFIVTAVMLPQLISPPLTSVRTSNSRAVTSEPGIEWQPALSLDGSQVSFTRLGADGMRVFIRSTINVAAGGQQALDHGEHSSWSPDSEFVRFWTCDDGCSWREVGRLGGSVRSLDVPKNVGCRWSPDGMQVACPDTAGVALFQVADGTSRTLTLPLELLGPESTIPLGMHSIAWSPDGARLAVVHGNAAWITELNVYSSSIWIVKTTDGELVRVTGEEHMDMSPAWLDENHLLFVSDRDGEREVYAIEVTRSGPRGEPVKVPGPISPHSISYSIGGRKLAYARFEDQQNIWSFSLAGEGPISIESGLPVTTGNQVIEEHDVSPDGAWIVYDSDLAGNQDVYKQRVDGGEPVRLTSGPASAFQPRWSPDGTEIAFARYGTETHSVLMVMPATGGTPVELPDLPEALNGNPVWSPNGLELGFVSLQSGRYETWLVGRDSVGGTWHGARQLTDTGCFFSDWASTDSGILCLAGPPLVLMLVSREAEVLWSRDLSEVDLTPRLSIPKLSVDGSTVYIVARHNDGSDGIWSVPLAGGEPELVVTFAGRFPKWQFSVGPRNLYVTVAEYESDIQVMDVEVGW